MSRTSAVEEHLWPLVEHAVRTLDVAGLAVGVIADGEVAARGFGVRDVRTGAPVTPETMFHLASVSKTFVGTAVVAAALAGDLDLDAPDADHVPELSLADGRAREVTARGLLSHTSGLPDVSDFGWHEPQLGDQALAEFARSLAGWSLDADPGTAFSYSNSGFELLGLLLSRVAGVPFEDAVRDRVLAPIGLRRSTFRRPEVPADLAASPHVGAPLAVPGDAYPYTRRHAPSSTLHADVVELCRWMQAHLDGVAPVGPALRGLVWRPVHDVGEPPFEEQVGLAWFLGRYRGERTASHSGGDPGFGSRLVLLPDRGLGVVVLANSNTVPTSAVAKAALDVLLAGPGAAPDGDGVTALRTCLPPVVRPVAAALAAGGPDAAVAAYHRVVAADPPVVDTDDGEFEKAVWGAIELHRTATVRPLLDVWTTVRPESSQAWTMTGWAHQLDGRPDLARPLLERALALDPDNADAALVLGNLPPE